LDWTLGDNILEGLVETPLVNQYSRTRLATQALVAPLSAEDMVVQTMPDVSPSKWHLAHSTWFWETFLLKVMLSGYREFNSQYNYLFNSYYEQIGARHARPERGALTRPSLGDIMSYRAHVDAGMERLLGRGAARNESELLALFALGIAHEEQHQELLLTDIKHVLSRNPLRPAAYAPPIAIPPMQEANWISFEGGLHTFGASGDGFAFDNEGPAHEAVLTSFALSDRPVTNAEYQAFIDDAGYRTSTLWLSDGWAKVQTENWTAPLYWSQEDGAWSEFTLHGSQLLDAEAPVSHLSYFEAAAYAEWAGARLPEEREWEHAASNRAGPDGRFVSPGISAHPGASPTGAGLKQMFGGVWEWTRSAYAAYPRYRAAAGAVGEYNGKFMCGQFVLKGGSCATPRGHVRATYRNFFPPEARWQFSGVRLAKDV
jgi:ergothioneine biosynthesis protein EgtB